jgi:hypothetical protein
VIDSTSKAQLDKTFIEFHPTEWTDVFNFQARLPKWVFRGQSRSEWNLATSLERSYRRIAPVTTQQQCEKDILNRFKRGAHHFIAHLPDTKNTLEWLALIQHYGGPTRLLDFTRSFYVAAFFALEAAESDAAIWCLNTDLLQEAARQKLLISGVKETEAERICNQLIDLNIDSHATIVAEPYRLNERLIAQQGLFVMPCSLQVDVESCLFNTIRDPASVVSRVEYDLANLQLGTFSSAGKVLKIVLPRKIHADARKFLRSINIDAANLFPGLDGFARSLHSHF